MQLGEILLESGAITQEQLGSALEYQKQIGGYLGQIMIKLGIVEEEVLLKILSDQLQLPLFRLDDFTPDPDCMALFPRDVIERLGAIPIRKDSGTLVVGVSDPTDFQGLDELRLHVGGNIEPMLISPLKMREVLARYFKSQEAQEEGIDTDDQSEPRKNRRRARMALSELVHELERDVRLRNGIPGIDDEATEGAETQSPDTKAAAKDSGLSERELLLRLIAALLERNVISESDLRVSIENILGIREVPSK